MKLTKRSIQTPKKVSNGLRGIMDIKLATLELRMLLRHGSSFQLILVKIPTITSMIWIQSWTQMSKQLLRAANTVKISMATTIQINSPESLTKMEIIPAKQDTAMEATEVTVAIKAPKVKINSADITEAKTKTNLVDPLSIMVKADIKAETIPTAAMEATMVQPIITMVTNTPIVRKEEIGGII